MPGTCDDELAESTAEHVWRARLMARSNPRKEVRDELTHEPGY
jgi:hypothetical protein